MFLIGRDFLYPGNEFPGEIFPKMTVYTFGGLDVDFTQSFQESIDSLFFCTFILTIYLVVDGI